MQFLHQLKALCLTGLILAGPATAEQLRPVARPSEAIPVAFSAPEEPAEVETTPAAITIARPVQTDGPIVGPETNLPLPRFVSLKTDEGNVRRGPSLSHRIDWVFLRRGMPLQVTAEYGHWRRVTDREGLGGWVHYSLLSGTRTVLIEQDMTPIYARADPGSTEVAMLELGVVARLGECSAQMCQITSGGYRGWADRSVLWGLFPNEIRD